MRASKCPAPAVCVRAPTMVLRPSGALSSQQWFRDRLVLSRPKVSCARSLRGNTFSGYKFDNKRPPAQSPKMMIVRERPHSPNRTACTRHSVRRPRASPYGMPRTSRLARQPSLPRTMLRAQEPEFHQGQGGGCRRGTRPGGEADGRKVAYGRKGERIRTEKIGFLGRKICK